MPTVISVALVAGGVALLMLGMNFGALHRSKIPRQHQHSAGAKSMWLIIAGTAMILVGVGWFVLRSIATD